MDAFLYVASIASLTCNDVLQLAKQINIGYNLNRDGKQEAQTDVAQKRRNALHQLKLKTLFLKHSSQYVGTEGAKSDEMQRNKTYTNKPEDNYDTRFKN